MHDVIFTIETVIDTEKAFFFFFNLHINDKRPPFKGKSGTCLYGKQNSTSIHVPSPYMDMRFNLGFSSKRTPYTKDPVPIDPKVIDRKAYYSRELSYCKYSIIFY